jgi:twitching motility protein PilT
MVEEKKLYPPDTEQLIREIYILAQRSMDHYLATGDDDFSFAIPGLSRFRVNAYRQRNSLAAVVRVVSFDIPKWEDIHIPR